jgi:hypothetical protein
MPIGAQHAALRVGRNCDASARCASRAPSRCSCSPSRAPCCSARPPSRCRARRKCRSLVSTLNSAACRTKAIVLLTGDVHYASMHANVLSMPHVFEFTSSSLARDEPTRAPKCPANWPTNGTQRLFATGYVNNFGVVDIELDSCGQADHHAHAVLVFGCRVGECALGTECGREMGDCAPRLTSRCAPRRRWRRSILARRAPHRWRRAPQWCLTTPSRPHSVTLFRAARRFDRVFVLGDSWLPRRQLDVRRPASCLAHRTTLATVCSSRGRLGSAIRCRHARADAQQR